MIGGSLGWGSLAVGAGQAIAGAAGGALGNLLGHIPGASTVGSALDWVLPGHGFNPFDDVEGWPMGDVGGMYTTTGGKGVAGMHPDMRRKVTAMMQANPNIRVNSGLRDTHMQRTMKKRGIGTSGGPSAHTRGMAADLGPPSEYGWITANASKFGLNSGVKHGEPWHVGMGDLPDIGFGTIGNFFDLIKNFASIMGGGAAEVGAAGGSLMSFIASLFGVDANATPGAGPAFNPNAFAELVAGTHNQAGILSGGANSGAFSRVGNPTDSSIDNAIPGASGSQIGLPAGGGAGTQAAGIKAATALFNAGFRTRSELEKIVAISWRESSWDPSAANPNGQDKGLMQINNHAWASLLNSMGYSSGDLLDIQKNANVAHRIYADSGNSYDAWNFSNHSMYWGAPARPGWERPGTPGSSPFENTSGSHSAEIVSAANITGLGDVMDYEMPRGTSQRGNVLQFNNSFIIGGGGGSGSGGIDARRTAQLIAGHLEDEMNNRLARAS